MSCTGVIRVSLAQSDVRFSFLTSGPSFRFLLPEGFRSVPELRCPIDAGLGARLFTFEPKPLVPDFLGAGDLVDMLTDRDGRRVMLIERRERPLTWWLHWSLSDGALMTHIREEDGIDTAPLIVGSVQVIENGAGGAPYLLLDPPLRSEVDGTPEYEETASFFALSLENGVINFRRPGFLSADQVMIGPPSEPDAPIVIRSGSAFGMEVQVMAVTFDEAHAVLASVQGTLSEA